MALQGQWSGAAGTRHPSRTILPCPGVQECCTWQHDPCSNNPSSRGVCLPLLIAILGWEIAMGAPSPYCLCFPTTMWAVHRNDHPIAFVWGNHTDWPTGSVLVPAGEYLSVGKTPSLFVLYCMCLIPSFRVSISCYLYPLSLLFVPPLLEGTGAGLWLVWSLISCWCYNQTCSNSTVSPNISQHLLILSKVLISMQNKRTTVETQ